MDDILVGGEDSESHDNRLRKLTEEYKLETKLKQMQNWTE